MPNFLELVAKERVHQIVEKGYTPEHDDEYTGGELADAAACYAANTLFLYKPTTVGGANANLSYVWPWELVYYNGDKTRKDQIITACAMLMAEYDRLEREEKKDTRCRGCHSLKGIKPDTWCGEFGVPMNEDNTRCESYNLPPFEASENNPLLNRRIRE